MTRLSSYFLPTVKEPPADAEALSHKLLVRAGMVRQLASAEAQGRTVTRMARERAMARTADLCRQWGVMDVVVA